MSLEKDSVDLAGHGDSVWGLISDKAAVQSAIEHGGVRTLVQGEFNDPSLYSIMAMQVVTGKAVMPVAVVLKPVRFAWHPKGIDLTRGVKQDVWRLKFVLSGGEIVGATGIDSGNVTLENGQSISEKFVEAQKRWAEIQKELDRIILIEDPIEKKDQLIDQMAAFDRDIVNSKVIRTWQYFENGKMSILPQADAPLFEVNYNAGGMLADIDNSVSFVENSQFGASHTLIKSDGTKIVVSKTAMVAIYFRDFNLNFLAWDSFAEKACLTHEAQAIFHRYHEDLARAKDLQSQKDLRNKYAALMHEASSDINSDQWARLVQKLEMLMTVVLVPPFEQKGKADEPKTIKMNKMAQNVSSFMVTMARSNLTAEDIDVSELRRAMIALEQAETEQERLNIRNSIKFLSGKTMDDLKPIPIENGPDERQLIVVDHNEFVQVKEPIHYGPFAEAMNRVMQDIAPNPIHPMTEALVRFNAVTNKAAELVSTGVLSHELASAIVELAEKEYMNSLDPEKVRESFSRLLDDFHNLVALGLSKDKWQGWLAFLEEYKEVQPKDGSLDRFPKPYLPRAA